MRKSVALFLCLFAAAEAGAQDKPPSPALKIVVVEGEGAVNIIQQKSAVAPVIEVRDRNNQPVPGATVTFAIRNGRATFSGVRTLVMTTNSAGRATAAGLTPIGPGAVQIGASAAFQGEAAAATILQTNVMTAAEAAAAASGAGGSAGTAGAGGGAAGGGGGVSTGLVAGVAGAGAAVAGAAVALGGGEPAKGPAAGVGVTPTGMGVNGVTEFTFTATGGSIGSPSYTWNFGDGSSATGNSVNHIFSADGRFEVSMRASGTGGEETAMATISVGNLNGNWTRPAVDGVVNRLAVVQQGRTITGQWIIEIPPLSTFNPTSTLLVVTVPLSGTVTSPRSVTLEQLGECQRTVSQGSVNETLTTMGGAGFYRNASCGDGTGGLNAGWTFTR